jgi:hypothetical protein
MGRVQEAGVARACQQQTTVRAVSLPDQFHSFLDDCSVFSRACAVACGYGEAQAWSQVYLQGSGGDWRRQVGS